MNSRRTYVRREGTPKSLALRPHVRPLRAILREVAAIAAGVVVLIATAWLIWAALAEAALALAHVR